MTDELVAVDDHLGVVLDAVRPLGEFDVTLLDAHGCVLAEDVSSPIPLPPFDSAAADGYAVRLADVAAATQGVPAVLPVVGEVTAGSTDPYTVQPGLCLRIAAGAPVPPGAEAVVPVEWTDGGSVQVAIHRSPPDGANIHRTGEDVTAGSPLLTAGVHLGAAQVGLLAASGLDRLRVRPRPRVVVLSTGRDLLDPGQPATAGRRYDSNSFLLTGAVRETGAIAYRVGILPEDLATLRDTLEDQLIRADAVVSSGGLSRGSGDAMTEVLSRMGSVRFSRVALAAGERQGFGTIGPDAVPFFALPGSPVSAFVSFEVFVRPALRRMLGVEPIQRPQVRATATAAMRSPSGLRSYLRGRLAVRDGAYAVEPLSSRDHSLAGLAEANALIVIPEDVTDVPPGDPVAVMMLERRHG
ncbi:MAG TPA: gephyrin-like molybdotransferase Glp [Mycobacteriales bacterium]|nr:gephyrin-like molybdotransferase Glp [Mycobacteriales bacterium]